MIANTSSPGSFPGILNSIVLIIISIAASLVVQHYISARYITFKNWTEGCPEGYEDRCKENSSVFRFSFALVIFFGCQSIGTFLWTKFFDSYWSVKLVCYTGLLVGFYFIKASVFDDNGYAWFARILAAIFVLYQQVILIDCAYSWNERWVEYGGDSDGYLWLGGLVVASCLLFGGSFSAIGIFYWQFQGCVENEIIISLTLCLCIVATLFQLFISQTGSLLTSAIVTAYATFICYSSISLNPNATCNPTI
eukprot:gene10380-21653_t